jgi:predicted transcriptional regulator
VEAAVEAVKTINTLYADELRFRGEALVLAARFERTPVDLPRRHRPSTNKEVLKALGKVRAVALSDARELPDHLTSLPWEGTDPSVARLLDRIAGSPTAALIEEAGPGLLVAETWEKVRSALRRKSLEREAQAREAAMAAVDHWLREFLDGEPIPLEAVEREATKAGIAIRTRSDEFGHASLNAAADRVGILALLEYPSKIVCWCLPGVEYDRDRFEPLKSALPMSAARG